MEVTCGVSQGSILGPQLFLVYINDMHINLTCHLSLFADDSALLFSHKDSNYIAEYLSKQLSSCKKWLIDNGLSLHVGKTECVLFGSRRKLGKVHDFRVLCDGLPVNQVTTVRYLGVHLDGNMNGQVHAGNLLKKCAGRVSFLYRKAGFLDFNCRKILCSALLQPYLDYCCSSWYSSITKHLKNKLDILQRRMTRYIFSLDQLIHVDASDFRKLSWMTFPDRVKFFKLIHVFKIKSGTAPNYMSLNFMPVTSTHSYNTRGSIHDFSISKDLADASTSFAYTAIKHWNDLPAFLKEIRTESVFRRKLRQFLTTEY